jgi:hypothetical protein
MNKQVKKKWIEELRSEKYVQGQGQLYKPNENAYCCLGVLCKIYAREKKKAITNFVYQIGPDSETLDGYVYPLPQICEWADINEDECRELGRKNDLEDLSFNSISDYIEKYL